MGKAVSEFLDPVLGLPEVVCWLLGGAEVQREGMTVSKLLDWALGLPWAQYLLLYSSIVVRY